MNEKFKDVTNADLETARTAAHEAFQKALAAADATKPETVKAASDAATAVDEHDAELAERKADADKAAEELAALQNRTFGSEDTDEDAPEDSESQPEHEMPEGEGADGETPSEHAEDTETETAPEAKEPVPVAAKTTTAKSRVAQLAAKTKRPAAPSTEEQAEKAAFSLVAAADSGFSAGSHLTWEEVGQSIMTKLEGFAPPSGDGKAESIHKFQTAAIHLDFPEELTITEKTADPMAVLEYAADERRLDGESVTAAGGWCAPSEVLYDLSEDESLDGILSLPEVAVKRGGIRYTPGPQFADFYAAAGFAQTEAQAIAGTAKTAVEVACPTFTEVRLEVEGLWIKVPILTEVGYPELVRRFSSGTMTAHEHWKNLRLINRIIALSTARDMATSGLGPATSDALEAIGVVADQRRQSQRLAFNRTVEVVVPFWVRSVYLNDLGRRNGRDKPATEAELNQYFTTRFMNVTYVYDWQPLPATATDIAYPAVYSALVYPAGTFIKGTSAVIKLGAIYDSAQLATNTYTGSFTEEGLLVAKMKLGSDLLNNLPTCASGQTGAANLVCA